MKKRIWTMAFLLAAALLLSGCALRTVDEMYSLPKRSESFNQMQSTIDMAMAGLEYSAPVSGENRQTVQMADLDGDGREEYLVFARGGSEKPMQILIFSQLDDGKYQIMEVIQGNGAAFEQVEYVAVDNRPGYEIVVGYQVSNQIMRTVSVYTFENQNAVQLMTTGYSRFLCCDLDTNGQQEILVMKPGETDTDKGFAVLYSYQKDTMERSVEAELSQPAKDIKRVTPGMLQNNVPGVYVASAVDGGAIITDVLALQNNRFVNVSSGNAVGTGVQTLRNYYVYADDVDKDGVIELPSLFSMYPLISEEKSEKQYLIRWYSMDIYGNTLDKMYSFYNHAGGWHLKLNRMWANRLSVEQTGNTYSFYMWDESFQMAKPQFTIYTMNGSDRETQAVEDNRFVLYRTDDTVYAARLETDAEAYGISKAYLINNFHLIHQGGITGET